MGAGAEALRDRFAEVLIAAATDPGCWAAVPETISEMWPGTSVLLQGADRLGTNQIGVLQKGLRADFVEAYADHYSKINPWIDFWASQPLMRAAVSDDQMPSSSLSGTEFYEDFLRPHGSLDSAVGLKLFGDAHRFAWLTVHYGPRNAPRYNEEIRCLLDSTAHLMRASIGANRYLGDLNGQRDALSNVLEAFETPALIITASGKVMEANSRASSLLDEGHLITLSGGNVLVCRDPITNRDLARIRRELRQQRSDLPIRDHYGRVVAIMSLFPTSSSCVAPQLAWVSPPAPRLLIVVKYLASSFSVENLAKLAFGLTRAEARLAARIGKGERLRDAAEYLGVSYGTARTQLRFIFEKTGTNSQSSLCAVLGNLR